MPDVWIFAAVIIAVVALIVLVGVVVGQYSTIRQLCAALDEERRRQWAEWQETEE